MYREVYMMNRCCNEHAYDNFAVDDEELKSVKKELADKKDMVDADFNAIEEEVRNPMTQAVLLTRVKL